MQGPLDAAVQVQDADATVFLHVVGCLDIAEELQRDARDAADAERDSAVALVRVGQRVVEEIGDQAWLAALEHLLRDLAAGFEPGPGQRGPVAPAAQLELQVALWREEHDKPAVRIGDRNRGIDHQRQDMVQHLGRPECTQAVEQRRQLPEVAHRRGRGLVLGLSRVPDKEGELGLASDPDTVPMGECHLADRLVIDERAGL